MANRLKNLTITKVALCPKGQNPDADIVFFKSDDAAAKPPLGAETKTFIEERLIPLLKATTDSLAVTKDTFAQIRADRQRFEAAMAAWSEVTKSLDDLRMALATSILWDTPNVPEALKSISQFGEAVDGVLRSLSKEDNVKDYSKMKPEELVAELQARDAATPADTITKEAFEKLQKSVTDQGAALAKANELLTAANAAIEKSKADLAAETAKREKLEAIEKARKDFPHLPGTDDEKAAIILAMAKMDGPAKDAMAKALAAGEKAAAEAMVEKGEGSDSADVSSAKAQLEAAAEEIRKAEPKLSIFQARDRAYKAHPDLYKQVRDEETARA